VVISRRPLAYDRLLRSAMVIGRLFAIANRVATGSSTVQRNGLTCIGVDRSNVEASGKRYLDVSFVAVVYNQ